MEDRKLHIMKCLSDLVDVNHIIEKYDQYFRGQLNYSILIKLILDFIVLDNGLIVSIFRYKYGKRYMYS